MRIQSYLRESPVFVVNAMYETVVTEVNRQLKPEGVNLLQGLILTALFFEESEGVTPSTLAEIFQTSRGNVSHAVSHLEAEGLVKRTVDRTDARRFQLLLKPEGKKTALRLVKFFDALQSRIEDTIGATDCRKIIAGLKDLEKALAAPTPARARSPRPEFSK